MTYFIFARDGTSRIVLKRDTREAAEKKARELKDLGWFDVKIEDADASKRLDAANVIGRVDAPAHLSEWR